MFEHLRARLDRFLADHTAPADARMRAAALGDALVEMKAGVTGLREALAVTQREMAAEQKSLEDAERRGVLAEGIGDTETVAVAQRFASKHRERVQILERKLAVQRDELALAEREFEEMAAQFRTARTAGESQDSAARAWDAIAAAGGARPEPDDQDLLKARADRAAMDAAVEAQLAHLKRKLGKE